MLACSWLLGANARAEHVALDTSGCAEVSDSELRALLTLELHTGLLAANEAEPEGTEHVRVACAGDDATLTRAETQEKRALSFRGVPIALRARVLALAIAELVRPREKPVETTPAPRVRPAEAVFATSAPAPASRPEQARYHLWAGVHGAALPLLALGGALLLRVDIRRLFAWSSSFDFSQVRTHIDRGQLRVQNISLRTGPALSFVLSRLTLSMGAGVRVSLLRLAGEAANARATGTRSFDTWLVAPTLFAGAKFALGRGAFAALELEAGHALRRVRADVQGGGARTLTPWRTQAVLGAGYRW